MSLRGIQIQDRDIYIFKMLQKFRYLHADQIRILCFPETKKKAVYNRLKKLSNYEYLKTVVPDYTDDGQYRRYFYITEKVRYFLDNALPIKRFHASHLRHDIGLAGVMFHLMSEYPKATISCETDLDFLQSYEFPVAKEYRGSIQSLSLRFLPDGCIMFPQMLFFIEYDRSTMAGLKLHKKFFAYEAYMQSERYRNDFGRNFKQFRVLFLCKDEKRVKSILTTYRDEAALNLFIFTTHRSIVHHLRPLHAPIWQKEERDEKFSLGKSS